MSATIQSLTFVLERFSCVLMKIRKFGDLKIRRMKILSEKTILRKFEIGEFRSGNSKKTKILTSLAEQV